MGFVQSCFSGSVNFNAKRIFGAISGDVFFVTAFVCFSKKAILWNVDVYVAGLNGTI